MPATNESRPEQELEATDDCWAAVTPRVTHTSDDVTCPRCRRVLTSERSLRLGYGRECWAKVCHRDEVAA